MDHYIIIVNLRVPVVADNYQDACMVAKRALERAQDSLQTGLDFEYSAYLTPNQGQYLKSRAINFS